MRIDVKSLREARGWTQRELATRSGVAQGQISAWEAGRQPNAYSAYKLAKAFGVTMESLFTEEGQA